MKYLDELNGLLIIDEYMWTRLELLAPSYSLYDLHKPRAVSKNMNLPAPLISSMSHWANEQLDD